MRIHNISIHINFYQNRFINECVRKNFLKFSWRQTERRKDVKTYFVRCRRTCVLNNNINTFQLCVKYVKEIWGILEMNKESFLTYVQWAKILLVPLKAKLSWSYLVIKFSNIAILFLTFLYCSLACKVIDCNFLWFMFGISSLLFFLDNILFPFC